MSEDKNQGKCKIFPREICDFPTKDFHNKNQKKDFHNKNQKKDFRSKNQIDFRNKIIPVPEMEYHPNGNLKFHVSVYSNGSLRFLKHLNEDGEKDGLDIEWHANGQKDTELNYKDGKQHGLLTVWHENGQKRWEYNFVNGKKHGLVIGWHADGQKSVEGNWVHGQPHGYHVHWWDRSGFKSSEGNYEYGEKYGKWIDYNQHGRIHFSRVCYKDRRVVGKTIEVPKIEYYDDTKTKPKFVTKVWDNRNLRYLKNFNANGEKHGLETEWHENGQKAIEANFVNGEKHGLMTEWYNHTQKQSEVSYEDGERHGLETTWHPNGQKSHEGNYVNGQKQGEFNYYDKDGGLTSTEMYNGGKLVNEPNENHRFSHEEVQPAM